MIKTFKASYFISNRNHFFNCFISNVFKRRQTISYKFLILEFFNSKFVIAKIDGTANDFPSSWNVKAYPTILLFKANDKKKSLKPKSYWDTGYSLHELFGFLIRETSFDSRTLTIATSEQLGSLLGDEDALRAEYEELERWERRNEGREVNEIPLLDYLYGEVVFDGHRWHIILVGALGLACVVLLLLVLSLSSKQTNNKKSKSKEKDGEKKGKDN